MTGKTLFGASLAAALILVALLVIAFQLGRGRDDSPPEADRPASPGRAASLERIEERLTRLEGEIASLRGAPRADAPKGGTEAVPEADRWAAVESTLGTLQLRIKGLEEDPFRRGLSFVASENAEMRREGINALARAARFDPTARAAIRGLLHDASPRVREQAAQILRDLKDKESAQDMKALLADADSRTRRRAVQALGAMDARDAAREIGSNLASDPDDRVRIAAADVLGRLKSADAVEFLSGALKDRNEEVRGEAIASLGEIGAASAAPYLRAMYDQDPGNHRLRLALALKNLGDEVPVQREISRLTEIVNSDSDARTKQQAQRELSLLTQNQRP